MRLGEDVKTRNDLHPENSPYEVSVEKNDSDSTLLIIAKDMRRYVAFNLAEHVALVRGDKGDPMFQLSLTLTDACERQLIRSDRLCNSCQVRRMAVAELLFQGH